MDGYSILIYYLVLAFPRVGDFRLPDLKVLSFVWVQFAHGSPSERLVGHGLIKVDSLVLGQLDLFDDRDPIFTPDCFEAGLSCPHHHSVFELSVEHGVVVGVNERHVGARQGVVLCRHCPVLEPTSHGFHPSGAVRKAVAVPPDEPNPPVKEPVVLLGVHILVVICILR